MFHLSRSYLLPLQVKEAISRRDGDGYWWPSVAIVTGRTEMVNVAMATIVEKLTETEVRCCALGDLIPQITPSRFPVETLGDKKSCRV